MKSCRPTGIGIAADAIAELLPKETASTSLRMDRWFMAVNDSRLPAGLRAALRLALAQIAAIVFRKDRLIFATHHAPLWRTRRHAVVVYDTIPLQFPEQTPVQTSYYRRVLPRVLRCADRVVTISNAVREEFRTLGFPGMDGAAVIPAWSPAIANGLPRPSRPPDNIGNHLLVVGARYPHKNLDTVLAALERVNASRDIPVKLVVAGCRREIWAKPWGGLSWFEDRGWVEVIERVSPDRLTQLYDSALALLYPSLAEGQGLPPLEAMSRECPVICSDLPVMHETCGDAAWYVPARDAAALARLVDDLTIGRLDPERRRKLEIFAQRLAMFGVDAISERWRAFVDEWCVPAMHAGCAE
jgi:glycosyltransferase involved in cell wall biosynthesis